MSLQSNHLDENLNIFQAGWKGVLDSTIEARDEIVLKHFRAIEPWGLHTAIDLTSCRAALIRDPEIIRTFAQTLCHHIQMRQYQDPLIVRFGEDPSTTGYTLVQLIETSDITAHFIERVNAACIDIFSCATYGPYNAASFCQQWFKAEEVHLSTIFRGVQGEVERIHV